MAKFIFIVYIYFYEIFLEEASPIFFSHLIYFGIAKSIW